MKNLILVLSVLLTTGPVLKGSPTLTPDTGAVALHQRALELQNRLRVMMVSLRPGDEDVGTLAALRLGSGAHVLTVFVTNGEAGFPDHYGVPPPTLAALRRNESAAALSRLEADMHFLNMADPGNIADTARVRRLWAADSLREKFAALMRLFRPSIVILTRDADAGAQSPLWQFTRSILLEEFSSPPVRKSDGRRVTPADPGAWHPERFWVDDGSGKGVSMGVPMMHAARGRRYRDIVADLDTLYVVQRMQRNARKTPPAYTLAGQTGRKRPRTLTDGIVPGVPRALRGLERVVRTFGEDVQNRRASRSALQERMVAVMDSVDRAIGTTADRTGEAMRVLIDWKGTLELLRNALLGVTVRYTLTEDILTPRQITFVRIDEVTGRGEGGATEVYFPSVERGWVLNEGLKIRLPLEVPAEYRLLTPEQVDFDLPWEEYNLRRPVPVRPVMLFLLHRGRTRNESFVYRIPLQIRYAPRFTAEVLTPIVRCIPGEFICVRLTNHSRDGVRDVLTVRDSLVNATGTTFRLNTKDESIIDTLRLAWSDSLDDGMYLFPITIAGIEMGRFGARRFTSAVDTTKRVALLTTLEASPTADALRRLGLSRLTLFHEPERVVENAGAIDVLMLDRRLSLLLGQAAAVRKAISAVSGNGGHVIILGQDAASWNSDPLWDALTLTRDPSLAPDTPLDLDSLHPFVSRPNAVREDAFREWVFGVGTHRVALRPAQGMEVPVRASGDRPLVVTAPFGEGQITYVDLWLEPQWMSIHPGAFRLLANLVSFTPGEDGK